MKRQPMPPRGFTLMETLFMMALLSFFLATAGQMFVAVHVLERDSRQARFAIAQFEHAVALLRRDAWRSRTISVTSGGALILTLADGKMVRWIFDPADESLWRDDGIASSQRWTGLGCRARFVAAGPFVVLKLEGKTDQPADEVCLVSQVQLTGAGASQR